MQNPLVEFLTAYGPQPSSNNLYDEFVVDAARKTGCAPLEIEQALVTQITAVLQSDDATSVILTGTAGDGKTYTARKVAAALNAGNVWGSTQKIMEAGVLPENGRRLCFIKDLSELTELEKNELFPDLIASLNGESTDIYVICVNDGHLLKFFRDRHARAEHSEIAMMLQNDGQRSSRLSLRLYNMSRQSSPDQVDAVFKAIVEHPDWQKCQGCAAATAGDATCPVQVNLEILRNKDATSFRARLRDIIRMAASDGNHLSIRQLLLMTVNTLLGDQGDRAGLLNCAQARKYATHKNYKSTNPYSNLFGENLTPRQAAQYPAFTVLNGFGVGLESNNHFDHGLLWASSPLPQASRYGDQLFDQDRAAYRKDPTKAGDTFNRKLVNQRRRLFFELPQHHADTSEPNRQDPWNLTVFKYGAHYVRLEQALINEDEVPESIRRMLFIGLNRMMTGEMTTEHRSLWLVAPAGVYKGIPVPLIFAEAKRSRKQAGGDGYISFSKPAGFGRAPLLRFHPNRSDQDTVSIELRPALFECLCRIAHGALPASFPAQSRSDVTRFQLKALSAMQIAAEGEPLVLRESTLSDGGALSPRDIDILN